MIPVKCMSCGTVIGHCDTLQDQDRIDRIAYDHDLVCTATPEQKHAAVIGLKLKTFTAQEGLL